MNAIDHAIFNLECLLQEFLNEGSSRHAKQVLSELAGYVDARDGTNTWPGYCRSRYEEAYMTGCNLLKVKGE